MQKNLIAIILLIGLVPGVFVYAWEDSFSLDFYSKIEDSDSSTIRAITQTRLWEYGRFAGFWKACRGKVAWLDNEPINTKILDEIQSGNYGSILAIAQRKKISLTTQELVNLTSCLADAYSDMQINAMTDMTAMKKAWSAWVYMDGDTTNSDYDIITDITKINQILFSEDLKYNGVKNNSQNSFANFLAGKWAPSLFPAFPIGNTGTWANTEISGTGITGTGNIAPNSLGWLWIGEICKKPTSESATSVENMIDNSFLSDLSQVLGWWSAENNGTTYDNKIPSLSGAETDASLKTASSDFYNTPRCGSDDIFCITFGVDQWSTNLLAWGKTKSIESIVDKHISLLEPISWTNLSSQKMARNSFQLNWSNMKFSNLIPKQLVYISKMPQFKDKYKEDVTPETEKEKLKLMERCANATAGYKDPIWGGYTSRINQTTTNIDESAMWLGVIDTSAWDLRWCLSLYLTKWRSNYYKSFGADLTEIQLFTSAILDEISDILKIWSNMYTKWRI